LNTVFWIVNQMAASIGARFDGGEGKRIMDRKKELKEQYKEIKIEAGVYQIRNTINNKIFVASASNLKTMNGKRTEMASGHHWNPALKKELIEFGAVAFVFETLEILEMKEDGYFNEKNALKKLEQKWLDKLQPYGDRGYNSQKSLGQ